jgi:hypothetical protein
MSASLKNGNQTSQIVKLSEQEKRFARTRSQPKPGCFSNLGNVTFSIVPELISVKRKWNKVSSIPKAFQKYLQNMNFRANCRIRPGDAELSCP